MKTAVTDKQRAALAHLIKTGVENLPRVTRHGGLYIKTGLNTAVLSGLWNHGFITASRKYLGGHTSLDLAITEKGRAFLAPFLAPALPTAAPKFYTVLRADGRPVKVTVPENDDEQEGGAR